MILARHRRLAETSYGAPLSSSLSPRGLVAGAALGLVTALAVLAPAAGASVAPASTVDYVALGDSYAAGVGAGTGAGACRVTDGAYPSLWATGKVDLTLPACSGATSIDVLEKQLGTLDAGTDLVSITVGANDLELTGALRTCAAGAESPACTAALAKIPAALATSLPTGLARLLTAVRTQAPQAKIAVTGYPLPFAAVADCGPLPLPATLREAGNDAVGALNKLLAAQARAAGATFVDVQGAFAGHELCTPEPWLVGAEGLSDSTVLHPTRAGQEKGYLAAFTEQIGTVDEILAAISVPAPSASASAPAPSASAVTPSASAVAPTASAGAGAAGEAGDLPVTGPGAGILAATGALLIGVGVAVFVVRRSRRVRFVSE